MRDLLDLAWELEVIRFRCPIRNACKLHALRIGHLILYAASVWCYFCLQMESSYKFIFHLRARFVTRACEWNLFVGIAGIVLSDNVITGTGESVAFRFWGDVRAVVPVHDFVLLPPSFPFPLPLHIFLIPLSLSYLPKCVTIMMLISDDDFMTSCLRPAGVLVALVAHNSGLNTLVIVHNTLLYVIASLLTFSQRPTLSWWPVWPLGKTLVTEQSLFL